MKNLCVRISERGYTLVIHSQQNKPNENKQNQVQAKLISLKCGYTCKLVEQQKVSYMNTKIIFTIKSNKNKRSISNINNLQNDMQKIIKREIKKLLTGQLVPPIVRLWKYCRGRQEARGGISQMTAIYPYLSFLPFHQDTAPCSLKGCRNQRLLFSFRTTNHRAVIDTTCDNSHHEQINKDRQVSEPVAELGYITAVVKRSKNASDGTNSLQHCVPPHRLNFTNKTFSRVSKFIRFLRSVFVRVTWLNTRSTEALDNGNVRRDMASFESTGNIGVPALFFAR